MTKDRRPCILIGGCYMPHIAHLLLRHEGFRRDYRIDLSGICQGVGGPNRHNEFSGLPLAEASLLIHQPPIWADWGDDGEIYQKFLELAAPDARQITIPRPVFHAFWPRHYNDVERSAAAQTGLDSIEFLFTYGDANVARMVEEGMSAGEIVERYTKMDIPGMIDLDRVKDHSIAHQQKMEAETTVKILDFILETYKARRLFNALDHLSNLLLLHIVNEILKKLDYTRLSFDLLEQLCVLNVPEIPIHPSILRYFNLKWATPGMRYQIGYFRRLTFEEYVYQYATARKLAVTEYA